jgi:hypothetical protein
MATRTTVLVTDDLDGTAGDDIENVRIAVTEGGVSTVYEIDLSAKNRKKLWDALAPFRTASRTIKLPADKRAHRSAVRKAEDAERTKIRQWAADNGFVLGKRGRIPKQVLDAYAKSGA